MPNRNIILTILITLALLAAVLFSLVALFDLPPVAATLIYACLFLVGLGVLCYLWFKRNAYILVDEMDAAVIFYKSTNNFAYFIDSAPSEVIAPGRPYNPHSAAKM